MKGYGAFQLGLGIGTRASHIVAFEIVKGCRSGFLVCHSCDNPPCCNPEHLWLGTSLDNTHDAMAKGRLTGPGTIMAGEDNGNAALDAEQVSEIRQLLEAGVSGRELGRRFGVSKTTIYNIRNGVTWRYDRSYKLADLGLEQRLQAAPNLST